VTLNEDNNFPVVMVRDNLDHIPHYELPAGYTFRWYRPGDEAVWRQIQAAADDYNDITLDLFLREFGLDIDRLAERQLYLVEAAGQLIGTATAWLDEHYQDPAYGRIHWVAITPAWQGQGLAKPLMTAICQRLKLLGHERAYLTTASARIPAINLYLQFGFVPFIGSPRDEQIWKDVASRVKGSWDQ
jgi:GNAT superfamily N-acetyltransferase